MHFHCWAQYYLSQRYLVFSLHLRLHVLPLVCSSRELLLRITICGWILTRHESARLHAPLPSCAKHVLTVALPVRPSPPFRPTPPRARPCKNAVMMSTPALGLVLLATHVLGQGPLPMISVQGPDLHISTPGGDLHVSVALTCALALQSTSRPRHCMYLCCITIKSLASCPMLLSMSFGHGRSKILTSFVVPLWWCRAQCI